MLCISFFLRVSLLPTACLAISTCSTWKICSPSWGVWRRCFNIIMAPSLQHVVWSVTSSVTSSGKSWNTSSLLPRLWTPASQLVPDQGAYNGASATLVFHIFWPFSSNIVWLPFACPLIFCLKKIPYKCWNWYISIFFTYMPRVCFSNTSPIPYMK